MKTKNIKKTKEEKELLRFTAVKLIIEGRYSKREVARILEVSYDSVCKWHKKYKEN